MYENSQAYQEWKQGVDSAYEKGSDKDIRAREQAGYDINLSDSVKLVVEENKEYIAELREYKRQFDDKEITEKDYNKKVEEYKEKAITSAVENELGTVDRVQSWVDGLQKDRMQLFLNSLITPRGQEEMDRWFTSTNQLREKRGLDPILPSSKERLYRIINTKHILDDSAFLLDTLLINPESGQLEADTEELQEYNISIDSL